MAHARCGWTLTRLAAVAQAGVCARRVLCLTCAVLVAAALVAESASAAPHFRLLGRFDSNVYTDGVRYAAYQQGAETTVQDTISGRSRKFSFSEKCPQQSDQPQPEWPRLFAIGGGHVLWGCEHPHAFDWHALIGDIKTGAVADAPDGRGYTLPSGADTADLYGIGTRWIGVVTRGYRWRAYEFLDWHTGAIIQDNGFRDHTAVPDNPHLIPALDKRRLWQRLCAPLHRTPADPSSDYGGVAVPDFEYAPPYGVGLAIGGGPFSYMEGPLRLYRCGSHRALTLDRHHAIADHQLGGGSVTWITNGARIFLYRLRTRHTYRFSFPPPATPRDPDAALHYVAHTRNRLFATVRDTSGAYRSYVMALPK